jgi:hypothetical protein
MNLNELNSDIIYREIRREINDTNGEIDIQRIMNNLEKGGLIAGEDIIKSRIKTYLEHAPKDIREKVKKV